MNIIIVNKEVFQKRPPVISTLLSLADLGYSITLITVSINDYWIEKLNSRGIKIIVFEDFKKRNSLTKFFEFRRFKNRVSKYLSESYLTNDYILWVIGGNTIVSLGKMLLKHRFILQIQELHENDKMYLDTFSKIINSAEAVFVNEYNRSVLYQCWFNLKQRPYVIPNKPYFVPSRDELNYLHGKYKNIISRVQGKKIILYQGFFGYPSRDMMPFVKAVKELGPEYCMVLLGPESPLLAEYRKIDPSIVHINFIPAPDYLLFTSMAYIGVVSYSPNILNNAYCAPNKIWEYSAFSLPMICNDIPGLKYTVELNHAGICIDENDVNSIKSAIYKIENNYQEYSLNSKKMFESANNKELINEVLNRVINS